MPLALGTHLCQVLGSGGGSGVQWGADLEKGRLRETPKTERGKEKAGTGNP